MVAASHALTGNDLRLEDVWHVAVHRAPVGLADGARGQMEAARALVDAAAENTYGISTGFGRFVSAHIPDELRAEGVADSEPLVPNDSAANRAKNRRVAIILRGGS